MTPARGLRGGAVALGFLLFCAGIVVGWWLRAGPPAPAIVFDPPTPVRGAEARQAAPLRSGTGSGTRTGTSATPPAAHPAAPETGGEPARASAAPGPGDPIQALREKHLRLPIDGMTTGSLRGMFAERRGGGRPHEAVDIVAPRNTPVHAVEDGTIAKLFLSQAGGITIYQFDPFSRFCYYYAHLERYADGLTEGGAVKRGDVLGYVGTSGNAPPETPHLHFAVFEMGPERQWWRGRPLDPYRIFSD